MCVLCVVCVCVCVFDDDTMMNGSLDDDENDRRRRSSRCDGERYDDSKRFKTRRATQSTGRSRPANTFFCPRRTKGQRYI